MLFLWLEGGLDFMVQDNQPVGRMDENHKKTCERNKITDKLPIKMAKIQNSLQLLLGPEIRPHGCHNGFARIHLDCSWEENATQKRDVVYETQISHLLQTGNDCEEVVTHDECGIHVLVESQSKQAINVHN